MSKEESIPTAMVRRRRISLTWLVPIAALIFVGVLVWNQTMRERGPMISIVFDDAGGIGKGSEIRYRGVTIGIVRKVRLDRGLEGVEVNAELMQSASGLAVEGTEFWVVRAQLSLQRVAGLETLIGPNYIALRPGEAGAEFQRGFVALNAEPIAEPPADGSLRLVLRTDRLGTLASGSPMLYREIRVGTIRDAHLADDATGVFVHIDIDPKFVPLVREKTRFWRSGGVGFDFGLFSGLSVKADSLEALMMSSISLATPQKKPGEPALPGAEYELADEVDSDWLSWEPVIELVPSNSTRP